MSFFVYVTAAYQTGFMTKSPAGWLPRNRDQLRAQRSYVIDYETTLLFTALETHTIFVTKNDSFFVLKNLFIVFFHRNLRSLLPGNNRDQVETSIKFTVQSCLSSWLTTFSVILARLLEF